MTIGNKKDFREKWRVVNIASKDNRGEMMKIVNKLRLSWAKLKLSYKL